MKPEKAAIKRKGRIPKFAGLQMPNFSRADI
jgi:hypothetical protein